MILWFDNAQGITSNGVFKAVTIKDWVADPANDSLETSNYLKYPAMALFCRLVVASPTAIVPRPSVPPPRSAGRHPARIVLPAHRIE